LRHKSKINSYSLQTFVNLIKLFGLMLSKNQIKYFAGLNQKKDRVLEQKFLVEGEKLIFEALHSKLTCELLITTSSFKERNPTFFKKQVIESNRIEIVSHNELEKISDTQTPQGIIGVFHFPKSKQQTIIKEKLIVGLESISDPGNMGTIIRNCDWFGIKFIFASGDCAENFNPKVIRASAGSVFHLSVYEAENFYDELRKFKESGFKIISTDLNGTDLFSYSTTELTVIVFSNEAHGPSQELLLLSDQTITIPKKGKAESLNVASASAVILSHFTK
jgi:TrmH family RNA methyltransferase